MTLRVYLVAATELTKRMETGIERFLSDRGLEWKRSDTASEAESLVEVAGRVCYLSFGAAQHTRGNAQYIANLIAQGHDSVLEHANFTLLVDGISRALSHQLVRHRIGFAYSQLSQQYHDESKAEFVEPTLLSQFPAVQERWKQEMVRTRSAYQGLIDDLDGSAAGQGLTLKERRRLVRSIARSVLPNATSTTLMVTGNARAWRHLLTVRGAITGDLEMREYCVSVYHALHSAAPHLYADFEVTDDAFGQLVKACDQVSSTPKS